MEEEIKAKLTVKHADNPGLVSAFRSWAGQALDTPCASCGGPFYNRDGSPVCMGCLRDSDYQRELVRRRLLEVLGRRRD